MARIEELPEEQLKSVEPIEKVSGTGSSKMVIIGGFIGSVALFAISFLIYKMRTSAKLVRQPNTEDDLEMTERKSVKKVNIPTPPGSNQKPKASDYTSNMPFAMASSPDEQQKSAPNSDQAQS